MFIAIAVYKGILVDTLNNGSTIKKMYVDIRQQGPLLFNLVCSGQLKVQACNDRDKDIVFHKDIPHKIYFSIAAWMERNFECNTYSNVTIQQFSFTDRTK